MLMTVKQYAEANNLKVEAVRQRIHRGRLPAVKLGRDWLIESSATFTDRRYNQDKVRIQIVHDDTATS